jgi:hypothetical protein
LAIFKAEGYGWDSGRIAIAQRSQKAAGYIVIEHCSYTAAVLDVHYFCVEIIGATLTQHDFSSPGACAAA